MSLTAFLLGTVAGMFLTLFACIPLASQWTYRLRNRRLYTCLRKRRSRACPASLRKLTGSLARTLPQQRAQLA